MYRHLAESIKESDDKQFISQAELDKYNTQEKLYRKKVDTYTKEELQSFIDEFDNTYESIQGSNLLLEGTKNSFIENIEIYGNTVQHPTNLAVIKSVGDKLSDGRYEIPIVCTGVNMFNKNTATSEFIDGVDQILKPSVSGLNRSTAWIKCKPNTTYTVSGGDRNRWLLKDSNGGITYFGGVVGDETPTVITRYNTVEIKCYIIYRDVDMLDNIQIVEGDSIPSYEPYQEYRTSIILNEPLRMLNKSYNSAMIKQDRLYNNDGVWGIERNTRLYVINGTEIWNTNHQMTNNIAYFGYIADDDITGNVATLIESFPINKHYADDIEGTFCGSSNRAVYLTLSKEKATTVNMLKEYLQENNLNAICPLRLPKFVPLPDNQQVKLKSFANVTHIYFDCEVDGVIKADVTKTRKSIVDSSFKELNMISKELENIENMEKGLTTTVKTDKPVISIEKTNNGYITDVKIEGTTLVNLSDTYNKITYITDIPTQEGFSKRAGFFKIDFDVEYNNNTSIRDNTIQIMSGKRYTYIVTIKNNKLVSNAEVFPFMWRDAVNKSRSEYIDPGFNGLLVFAFDCINDTVFNFGYRHNTSSGKGSYEIGEMIVLEGDHTKNPPMYFKGIKSTGEDIIDFEVSTVSKNLIPDDIYNGENWYSNKGNTTIETHGDLSTKTLDFKCTESGDSYTIMYLNNNSENKKGIDLNMKPYTDYILSFDASNTIPSTRTELYILKHYIDQRSYLHPYTTILGRLNLNGHYEIRFNSTDRPEYISIRFDNENIDNILSIQNLSLVEADKFTGSFIPHISDKKIICYKNSENNWEKPILRSLPNGVKDTIEKHSDGKYYYHKRCEEIILNGTEPCSDSVSNFGEITKCFCIDTSINRRASQYGQVFDKFTGYYNYDLQTKIDNEGASINAAQEWRGKVYIRINKSKLSSLDNAGMQSWLAKNNVIVLYELYTEEVYECSPIDLQTFDNDTTLSIEAGPIVPKTTVNVLSDIGSVVDMMKHKVSTLENEIYNNHTFDNMILLESMYSADTANLQFDIGTGVYTIPNEPDYDHDLYRLLIEIITNSIDKINISFIEGITDFYTMTDRLSFDMADNIFTLLYPEE